MAQYTEAQETTSSETADDADMMEPKDAFQPIEQQYPDMRAAIEKGLADVAAGRVRRMSFSGMK